VFTKNRTIDLRFVLLVISFSFGFGQGFLQTRPGNNQVIWLGTSSRGRQVSSGIHFLTLDDGNKTIQEKITIIR